MGYESKSPKSINDWRDEVHTLARAKGWHDRAQTIGEAIALQHSELSEALEEHRNGRSPNEVYYEGEKPCGIPTEMADALIRILDFCGLHNIDIEQVLRNKHAYNESRTVRHGGKIL